MSGSLNAFVTALASAVAYQNGKNSTLATEKSTTSRCSMPETYALAGEDLRKLLSVSNQHALEAVRQVCNFCGSLTQGPQFVP